jgi:uncharacterized membrane protein YeaQ/YmgE (transglycosylase-associated protein family)
MDRLWEIFGEHGWLWWIIIGLVAGAIAKLIMPGRDPGGWIVTILIGIAGAVVSAFIGDLLGLGNRGDSTSLLSAIVGALIILFIYRMIATRGSRGRTRV